ncbi:MAG: PhzF family phenazine biosynthesis protein [Planctomycetes bacterium]|jgi:trans-2,3-dihydro-3-hydroxyanthranilate isomerase|nr:PhzF family phenazine biosynthesis protein [Planctomycetota bacterium]
MNAIDIWIVDAFAGTPLAGNPAGVVLSCEGLDVTTFRKIAFEAGFSDSAFVSPGAAPGEFRLRFFSPYREVDVSGHGTVAAFWLLAEQGRLDLSEGENAFTVETNVAKLPVFVDARGGKPVRVMMGQIAPVFETPKVNNDKLAALLGVGRNHIAGDLPVEIVSTGLRTLHIPIDDLGTVSELKPLMRGLVDLSTRHDVMLIQVFTRQAKDPGAQVHCRVFAPALGVEEDPVSGMPAGSLAAHLARHGALAPDEQGRSHLVVEQGEEMGRPGKVEVEMRREGKEIAEIRIGGTAVVALEGRLRIAP